MAVEQAFAAPHESAAAPPHEGEAILLHEASRRYGERVAKLQTGYVYHYAFAMLIGVMAFVTWVVAYGR